MLSACLLSFLVSFFVARRLPESRSAGLLPPLMERLSACVINRIREAERVAHIVRRRGRTPFELLVALHFRTDAV